jgi:hypothetical protein
MLNICNYNANYITDTVCKMFTSQHMQKGKVLTLRRTAEQRLSTVTGATSPVCSIVLV